MSYRKISETWSVWEPDSAPQQLLPPDVEPDLSFEEEFGNIEGSRRIYYERSGRYQGVYSSPEEAAKADQYEFARKFIPGGGKLPWENLKGEEE